MNEAKSGEGLSARYARHRKNMDETQNRLSFFNNSRKKAGEVGEQAYALHKSKVRPWIPPEPTAQEVAKALAPWPIFASHAERLVELGGSDIHCIFRVGYAGVRLRADGEMTEFVDVPVPMGLLAEFVSLFGLKVEACQSEMDFFGNVGAAVQKFELAKHKLSLRLQAVQTAPDYGDVILRVLMQESLDEEATSQESQYVAERKSLVHMMTKAMDEAGLKACSVLERSQEASQNVELFEAIEDGDAAKFERALGNGFGANGLIFGTRNRSSYSQMNALHAAVNFKRDSWISRLLDAGVDPDQVNDGGETPLIKAARMDNLDALVALLDASLVDAQSFMGRSALTEASWCERTLIVERLAGVSTINLGEHDWSRGGLPRPSWAGAFEPHGTALSVAAQEGYIDICKILLSHGADPRIAGPKGENAMLRARDHHEIECFELLTQWADMMGEREALELEAKSASGSAAELRL